jgi:hypothetical protein
MTRATSFCRRARTREQLFFANHSACSSIQSSCMCVCVVPRRTGQDWDMVMISHAGQGNIKTRQVFPFAAVLSRYFRLEIVDRCCHNPATANPSYIAEVEFREAGSSEAPSSHAVEVLVNSRGGLPFRPTNNQSDKCDARAARASAEPHEWRGIVRRTADARRHGTSRVETRRLCVYHLRFVRFIVLEPVICSRLIRAPPFFQSFTSASFMRFR